MSSHESTAVRLDPLARTLTISHLSITDADLVAEAARWSAGVRGDAETDPERLAAADLEPFARKALVIGSHALSATGQSSDAQAVQRLLTEVTDSSARVLAETRDSSREAAEAVAKATAEAKQALLEAERAQRKELTTAVLEVRTDLAGQLRALLGGEKPELLDRLQPVLDSLGGKMEAHLTASATALAEKAAKQYDPSDPTSPLARHAATITADQARSSARIEEQQRLLAEKLDVLSTRLQVQQARLTERQESTRKGADFETLMHQVLGDLAAGLGDEYSDTTQLAGVLPRNKKGDGVLTISDSEARVVLEYSDSSRSDWTSYLDIAERNRQAQASLGIVPTVEQNQGHTVRVLGGRRILLAFDPAEGDHDLLRAVLQILRAAALSARTRTGEAEIHSAQEHLEQALAELERIDKIKKHAAAIQNTAGQIDTESSRLAVAIRRSVDHAMTALAGAAATRVGGTAEAA